MFRCKVCGEEFADWHALGGHMRKHTSRQETIMGPPKNVEWDEELLARALGKLSELSPQEAWQIVVNWIMDVYRQAQLYNEIAQTYQQKIQESDAKVEAIQNDLRNLQQMVNEGRSFRI